MIKPLVTVLINNYNYASFLGQAIESAIQQTYSPIEVVVVDDGSTDDSRAVIARYGPAVVPVLKENGGQASAFNVGIAASKGDILCFLDADDFYYPEKVHAVVDLFATLEFSSRLILIHHPLDVHYDDPAQSGLKRKGPTHECPLNLYAYAQKYRHVPYPASPTSGVSINRPLANRIFPLPEAAAISADDFVVKAAALIGEIHALNRALGGYRVHGRNHWFGTQGMVFPEYSEALDEYLNRKLIENDLSPVISWHDSMYSWRSLVLERRWGELTKRMLAAMICHRDFHTAEFTYETIKVAAMETLKSWRAQ
jgi:glycosyltransferase involved in cell wall biosynthesis